MSEIDIERLKVDESLWPEGKWYWCGRPWVRGFHSDHEPCSECIPRPTNPEWVDGLPPEGVECEFRTTHWRIGKVVCYVEGRHGKQGVVQFDDDWQCFCPEDVEAGRVRPIQTPEQRQREELADVIRGTHTMLTGSDQKAIADAILSKYNLTEK